MSTIGNNIKRLRDEQNITQQVLAEKLCISFQAISKWETGITVPDTLMLPDIAEFFGVAIDELFKPDMTAYRNKSERLAALYESDIDNTDSFEKAEKEYKRMFSSADFTDADLGSYAYLPECHARHYLNAAEEYYERAIETGSELKESSYHKNQRQHVLFLASLGRAQESVEKYKGLILQEPDNSMNYSSLIFAFECAGDLQSALQTAKKALARFPNDAMLLTFAGEIYKELFDFEHAQSCLSKAFEIDGELIDTQYSLASLFAEKGLFEKASQTLRLIIKWNSERGYENENKWAEKELQRINELCR